MATEKRRQPDASEKRRARTSTVKVVAQDQVTVEEKVDVSGSPDAFFERMTKRADVRAILERLAKL